MDTPRRKGRSYNPKDPTLKTAKGLGAVEPFRKGAYFFQEHEVRAKGRHDIAMKQQRGESLALASHLSARFGGTVPPLAKASVAVSDSGYSTSASVSSTSKPKKQKRKIVKSQPLYTFGSVSEASPEEVKTLTAQGSINISQSSPKTLAVASSAPISASATASGGGGKPPRKPSGKPMKGGGLIRRRREEGLKKIKVAGAGGGGGGPPKNTITNVEKKKKKKSNITVNPMPKTAKTPSGSKHMRQAKQQTRKQQVKKPVSASTKSPVRPAAGTQKTGGTPKKVAPAAGTQKGGGGVVRGEQGAEALRGKRKKKKNGLY